MNGFRKLFGLVALLAMLAPPALLLPDMALAQEESVDLCGGDTVQATAYVPIPTETPNIYARAGRAEDAVRARLYFQPMDDTSMGECILLGEATLSIESWRPIGRVQGVTDGQMGSLILALSSQDHSQAGASSPMVVFAGETPPCQLASHCKVQFGGGEFDLSPRKLSMDFDTLRAGQLLPIENDHIQKVIYSVDNRQVYTSKQLEAFNTRYVPGGKHTLGRTVVMASGQSLHDSQEYEHGALGEPLYLVTAVYSRFARLFNAIGILLALWLVWVVGFSIAKWVHQRRQWRLNHIAGLRQQQAAASSSALDGSPMDFVYDHKRKVLAGVAVLAGLFVVYSYVLTVQITDGVSMSPTLEDRSRHPLFILPAMIGRLTGGGYVPPRGTIVVVDKTEHNLFDTTVAEKSYVVKRVVGIPGDRVVIQGGIITVYNDDNPNGYVPDDEYGWVADRAGSEYFRTDITLKENELFVVGDNRDESIDSRFYGPVGSSQVIGRVL